ncbi:tyrosine-protein kinase [Spirosoma areae]
MVLAFGAANLYLRYAEPIYLVNASLLIREQPKSAGEKILEKADAVSLSVHSVLNEVELLKSRSLMLRVVEGLNLTVQYYKQNKIGRDEELYNSSPVWIYSTGLTNTAYQGPVFINIINKEQYELQDKEGNSKGKYSFNNVAKSEYGTFRVLLKDSLYRKDNNLIKVTFHKPEQIAGRYQNVLKIASTMESSVLKLFLEESVPARGKAVLNKLLEIYTQSALDDKNLEAKYTLQFIDERLKLITGELGAVEHDVESYRNSQEVTDLRRQGDMFLDAVNTTDTKLNEADLNLELLDGVESYMKNSQSGIAPAMSALTDPILKELIQKLSNLQGQHEKYSRTMQDDNPFLQSITKQIESTKAAIQENVNNQRQNLQLSRANLQKVNQRFESSIHTLPRKEREFITIKRQQGIKESLYLLLLQKKEEAAISYASAVTDSRIIDEATSTAYPLKPSPINAYMVAFLMGLLVPIGIITVRMRLSGKVQTRNEIETETGLTVFGEIMRKPRTKADKFVGIETDKTITEQFKVLRANLPYTNGNMVPLDNQLLLVTSSISGEGKSFFSINMAYSLAQLEKRVIILEADLRQPKTTTYLGMPDQQVTGMSDYLAGQCEISDLIRATDHPNLYLISSGDIPHNPSELLSNQRMDVLLKELRQQFDYIILDTPPVAFVADTTILAPYADKVFYIVRHEYTPRNCMQLLTSLSASQKFKSLHVIFNGVAYEKSQEFGYGYGYR